MQPTDTYRAELRLLAAAFGCAVLHHYLFYGHSWGVSYPLFAAALYALYYTTAARQEVPLKQPVNLLLLPVLLLSLTYMLHSGVLLLMLNALMVPLLILIHMTWSSRHAAPSAESLWFQPLEQLAVQTLRSVPRPIQLLLAVLQRRRTSSGGAGQGRKVLLGLLLSAPLVFMVLMLLASADTVFDRSLARLPDLLAGLELGEEAFRLLWVAAVTVGLFAYINGLHRPKPRRSEEGGPASPPEYGPVPITGPASASSLFTASEPAFEPPSGLPKIDPTVAGTMLVMLNAVYALFALVQFSYFFAGAELPEGITYAAYARKGFAELVLVTLINLSVLIAMVYGVRRPGNRAWLALRSLLALLVGFSTVMLVSAYLRLALYEEAYGFTVTRILVHAFMLLLTVLFLLALVKLWKPQFPLVRSYLIAALAGYVILNYASVDGLIARGNIARYERTGHLDTGYLGSLGYEAVPYVAAMQHRRPDLAELSVAAETYRTRLQEEKPRWMEWNLARWRAERALELIE
ncbi:DUF4173 domain-containing protein [Paenibacillus mucilaginosus]|uniref:Uncharacterized protein n=2 Tax=Paenibacillus mucilaginosus TaxID=61624 RepID=I0BTZ3_9BACL|nr:DUF4173 domain-containing protein [Paenibacillus mucilaginosus]AEI45870.1 hypothetical protein KNP414_07363 [Paenibacillus mucilaginosus KNP414]AFH65840.2 hypothetical protein B2K_34925 [Paenibacillus mucilaginosus K02]MCG7217792.1 DUF4173 domain-containing protein [Paenibacillus mucilaginosus]WDM27236.1 DUF4173 domain-containing protein [Paenibacillus mucilaginosus]